MRSKRQGRGARGGGRDEIRPAPVAEASVPAPRPPSHAPGSPGSPGVALIAIIMLLAGLLAIAGPFLLSTALEARESRLFAARARARIAAEGALSRALWCLSRTTEGTERAGLYGFPFDTPDYDTLDELAVDFEFARPPVPKGQKPPPWPGVLEGEGRLAPTEFRNPRGEIWRAEIEDEQGKINVNSATPALLGNLLGSAVLEADDNSSLRVGSTLGFASDGDDRTVDGFVRVGREIIAYTSKTETTLDGLARGCFGTDVEAHPRGSLVFDARGWAIARFKFPLRPGGGPLTRFQSVPAILRISELNMTMGGKSMALEPETYEAVERCLTAVSYRPKADGWVRREKVVGGAFDADRRDFVLRDNTNFGPGTVVRFVDSEGRVRGYGRVYRAKHQQPPVPTGASVTLEYGCGFGWDGQSEIYMEAELPHAINVNTARFPVLVACMTGLALSTGGPSVTPEQAALVANRLISKSVRDERGRDVKAIRNKEDLDAVLLEAVQAGDISAVERQAILENATVPGSTWLKTGTAPFCFRAYNLFTIEATAAVNSPTSGRPLAVHTVREMVQMPTDASGVFLVRSQKEFEEQIKFGVGRKVNTWPVWLGLSQNNNVPDENTADGVGDVRLATGRAAERSLPGAVVHDHFENNQPGRIITPDGLVLQGGALAYGGAFNSGANGVLPGEAEAWFASRDWSGSIFHAQGQDGDLLDVYYDRAQGELVMDLSDGTVNGNDFKFKTVQYRQAYNLGDNVWQHIRAAYKSSRLGGQAFQVDGGMVAPAGAARYSPMCTLGEALDAPASNPAPPVRNVAVDDTSAFPAAGAFIIDGEIFEYTGTDATTFLNVRRGRRYTQPMAHQPGAPVQIYGYSVRIADIPLVSGRVADDIAANPVTTINKAPKAGPPAVPGGIDDAATTIPVVNTAGFQSSGYLWCGQECIYYGKKSATEFQDCIRGQLAGPAAAHGHGTSLSQISLMVTNYDNYPNSGTVQIDQSGSATVVEWLDYYQKRRDAAGRCYLMATFYQNPTTHAWYRNWGRGSYGSGARNHDKGAKVLPVFDVHGPQCGNTSSPQFEPVTVMNPDGSREARKLKRVYEYTGIERDIHNNYVRYGHTFKVGLDDFVARDYRGARLLKFPSGELATRLPLLAVGGGFQGVIDELRVCTGQTVTGALPVNSTDPAYGRLNATATNVIVQMPSQAAANQVPATGGAVRIDDEMIYYQGRTVSQITLPYTPQLPYRVPPIVGVPPWDGDQSDPRPNYRPWVVTLTGVRRAVLGTRGADHAPGTAAAFLDCFPVTELAGGLTDTASDVNVRSATGFDDEGYLVAGSEIVGYTRRAGNTLKEGMFRGAFGTQAQVHGAGELTFPLPFRYWDRFIPESDSSELACFQGGFTAAGSNWYDLELAIMGNPSRVYTLMRFDGQPEWSAKPTNREGGLYAFFGTGPHRLRTSSNRPVRADQIEYRVFFPYALGDSRGDAWKETPAVDTVAVSYGNPLVVMRREVGGR